MRVARSSILEEEEKGGGGSHEVLSESQEKSFASIFAVGVSTYVARYSRLCPTSSRSATGPELRLLRKRVGTWTVGRGTPCDTEESTFPLYTGS